MGQQCTSKFTSEPRGLPNGHRRSGFDVGRRRVEDVFVRLPFLQGGHLSPIDEDIGPVLGCEDLQTVVGDRYPATTMCSVPNSSSGTS